ncbi:MAG: hypothetical protein VKK04_04410 [Synechococcales bacterium]|nr:hypothetical protein [Synechococcales bacterium]
MSAQSAPVNPRSRVPVPEHPNDPEHSSVPGRGAIALAAARMQADMAEMEVEAEMEVDGGMVAETDPVEVGKKPRLPGCSTS